MTVPPIGMRVLAALRAGGTTVKQIAKEASCSEPAAEGMLGIWAEGGLTEAAGTKHTLTSLGTDALQAWESEHERVLTAKEL